MSSILISGDTSGAITLAAPAVAGTNTLTLPASTGTLLSTANPQSGGVIQVVSATLPTGPTSTSSTSYVTTGITATITPKFNTSKILIQASTDIYSSSGGNCSIAIFKNGSQVSSYCYTYNEVPNNYVPASLVYLDSPASSSALTYTLYFKTSNSSYAQYVGGGGSIASSIVLLEVAA